jgi:hypothetical protein
LFVTLPKVPAVDVPAAGVPVGYDPGTPPAPSALATLGSPGSGTEELINLEFVLFFVPDETLAIALV